MAPPTLAVVRGGKQLIDRLREIFALEGIHLLLGGRQANQIKVKPP